MLRTIYFRQDGRTYRFDPNTATRLGTDRWDPKSGNENRRWVTMWKTKSGRYVALHSSIYQDERDSWRLLDEREALDLLADSGMSLTDDGEAELEKLAAKLGEDL